jgi:hypothetical protein
LLARPSAVLLSATGRAKPSPWDCTRRPRFGLGGTLRLALQLRLRLRQLRCLRRRFLHRAPRPWKRRDGPSYAGNRHVGYSARRGATTRVYCHRDP